MSPPPKTKRIVPSRFQVPPQPRGAEYYRRRPNDSLNAEGPLRLACFVRRTLIARFANLQTRQREVGQTMVAILLERAAEESPYGRSRVRRKGGPIRIGAKNGRER